MAISVTFGGSSVTSKVTAAKKTQVTIPVNLFASSRDVSKAYAESLGLNLPRYVLGALALAAAMPQKYMAALAPTLRNVYGCDKDDEAAIVDEWARVLQAAQAIIDDASVSDSGASVSGKKK